MAQDNAPNQCTADSPVGRIPPTGVPQFFVLGRPPARDMLSSDTRLIMGWNQPPAWPGLPWRMPEASPANAPWTPVGGTAAPPSRFEPGDIRTLQEYLQSIGANHLVPAPEAPSEAETEEEEKDPFSWTFGEGELKSKDGGHGVRAEIKTGQERDFNNDTVTHDLELSLEIDNDWRGKWDDFDFTFAEAKTEASASAAVAEGSFGDADSLFNGNGAALGAEASAGAQAGLTNSGLEASAKAAAEAYALKGEIASSEDHLLGGKAEAAAVRAEGEAKAELVVSTEEVTLSGKLGASANLVEASADGSITITPRRVAAPFVSLYNWWKDTDHPGLDENWDVGIVLSGGISGAVGAQASLGGEASYKDGVARAEVGAKIGLGPGAGVKVGGGLVGMDKVGGWISEAWSGIWD